MELDLKNQYGFGHVSVFFNFGKYDFPEIKYSS